MKKILCIILSLLIIFSTFATVGIISFGVSDNVSLSTFVSDAKEMIDEYGLYVGTESDSFQIYSEENESEFKTRRLIIKSDSDIDTLNAISVISGFRNLWVLQFETEEDTATAYEYYCSLDCIKFVETDSVVTVSDTETAITTTSQKEYLSWGPEHIGFDELNEIITENHIKLETVYVAVIDTGVDYNHELLKNRVEKTTFNSSDSGKINDPIDDDEHGTHVAGIIADCTLGNVIIRPYKCLNSKGEGTDLTISAGIYQAADDENDVINMSFGTTGESPLVEDALSYAKEKNDPVMVAAMGNNGSNSDSAMPLPAKSPLVIGVSAIDENNEKLSNSNFSKNFTELAAPGGTINSTVRNNGQKEKSGTSMATPFVSAVAATAKAIYPYYDSENIRKLMQETAITLTTDIENLGYFGYGMVYATGILRDINKHNINCSQSPIFSFEEGLYDEPIVLEFFCEDGTETYYTTDGSIPTKASLPYDGKPITISESSLVMAVSYKDSSVKSPISSAYYGIPRVSGYPIISVIIQNGYVHFIKKTDYTEFEIPEIYKDMVGNVATIKGIYSQAFHDRNFIKYMKMPDTVTEIQTQAFESCVNLKTVIGNGVVIIGDEVFLNCSSLNRVYLENTQSVGDKAFKNCSSLQEINLPNVTNIGDYVFSGCESLRKIDLSRIKKIDSEDVFANVSPAFVDLRNLESTKSLPNNSSVLFSSKLSEVECFPENLTIYGTKGTYAEEYANENGYTFITVPYIQNELPDTAVISDILTVNAIGAELSYQWYSSKDGTIDNGIVIKGELSNKLVLEKTENAPYYFCVVTYNDNGTPRTMYTNIVKNLDYTDIKLPADYSLLDELLSEIPEDLSIYTDESVAKLKSVEDSIDRNLDITNQEKIVEYIDALKKAIEELELKPADYSLIENAKSKADKIDRNLYTHESLAKLDEVIAAIDYNLTIDKQSQVEEMANAIEKAISELKYKGANYSGLEKVLFTVPMELSIYTEESVGILQEAISSINYSLDITQQEQVDEYMVLVTGAITMLKLKSADYSLIENAKSKADKIDRNLYTHESLAKLDEAIAAIDYDLTIDKQSQVEETANAIEKAISELEYKGADYSGLEKVLSTVPMELSIYTEESVGILQEAISSINYSLDITQQEQVDEYVVLVTDAITMLKIKSADYSELENVLKTVPEDLSIYTDESVAKLKSVEDSIDRNLDITNQEKIAEYINAVKKTIEELEYKPANYSSLLNIIETIPEDLSIYTYESVDRLESIIESIDYSLDITQQEKVDEYTKQIEQAIENLEKECWLMRLCRMIVSFLNELVISIKSLL